MTIMTEASEQQKKNRDLTIQEKQVAASSKHLVAS